MERFTPTLYIRCVSCMQNEFVSPEQVRDETKGSVEKIRKKLRRLKDVLEFEHEIRGENGGLSSPHEMGALAEAEAEPELRKWRATPLRR